VFILIADLHRGSCDGADTLDARLHGSAPAARMIQFGFAGAARSGAIMEGRSRKISMIQTAARHFTFQANSAGVAAPIGLAASSFTARSQAGCWVGSHWFGKRCGRWCGPMYDGSERPGWHSWLRRGSAKLAFAVFTYPGPLAWSPVLNRNRVGDAVAAAPVQRCNHLGGRLLLHGLLGLAMPLRDTTRMLARRGMDRTSTAAMLILPIVGSGVFLAPFASANSLIGSAFAVIRFPDLSSVALHLILWMIVLLAIWPTPRPRNAVLGVANRAVGDGASSADVPLAT
jgi:hypothetical protein